MAGIPESGKTDEIGHECKNSPFPFPCDRSCIHNKGPGRNKFSGKCILLPSQPGDLNNSTTQFMRGTVTTKRSWGKAAPALSNLLEIYRCSTTEIAGAPQLTIKVQQTSFKLVGLFTSLLAIPLACQRRLHATLFTGLQIVGVTLHFLDNVLLLNLPLKPAQRIFERLAFLYANLCQGIPPPNPPNGLFNDTGTLIVQDKEKWPIFRIDI